ncbi:MAG: hypothetical protein IIC88_07885 [Chloroflexi bacterium]|nr:hypothetical protein [Chloroflexota bacterium]
MKSWLSSSLLVAGLLLGAVAAACGGGDGSGGGELSLEQYFEQVDAIVAGLEQRTVVLGQALEESFDSEEEEIEAYRDNFTTVLPVYRDFGDDFDEMEPPAEVADAHGELVAGFASFLDGLETLIDQFAEVESASELSALLLNPDSELRSATGRFAAACLQLKSIADDNDIDVDLICAE